MQRWRSVAGICGSLFLAVACGTTPIGSLQPTVLNPEAARARLCDASDATSLPAIANQLEQLRASDTTPLQQAMAMMLQNIHSIQVDSSSQPARDAAVAAVESLQQVITDPATRDPAATEAAASLRTLRAAIC